MLSVSLGKLLQLLKVVCGAGGRGEQSGPKKVSEGEGAIDNVSFRPITVGGNA